MEYGLYNQYVYEFRMAYGYQYDPMNFDQYVAYMRTNQNMATQNYEVGNQNPCHGQSKTSLSKRKVNEHSSNVNSKKSKQSAETTTKRAIWVQVEEEVLVAAWKENFHLLDTVRRDEGWAKILSSVESVGEKNLKQCKKKIDNLKDDYKEAKQMNKETGSELHKSPFFDIFDQLLGDRPIITLPHVKEVGAGNLKTSQSNGKNVLATSTISTSSDSVTTKSSSIPTPTRSQVDEFLLKGKGKCNASKSGSKTQDLLEYLKEDRIEKFLEKIEADRMRNQNEERKLEREFLRELFKK